MARILVIDDEAGVREILRRLLERAGHEVAEAADGAVAVDMSHQGHYDVFLTDMYMPGQEGIETIPLLRAAAPQAKVIAMSGGGRLGKGSLLDMARRLGADATLAKPFGPDELVRCVEAVMTAGSA